MPKYAKRKDNNHNEIQEALERAGYLPTDISTMGRGVPDILCASKRNVFVFLEAKGKGGTLTDDEIEFFEKYNRCPVHIARDPETALEIMSQYD